MSLETNIQTSDLPIHDTNLLERKLDENNIINNVVEFNPNSIVNGDVKTNVPKYISPLDNMERSVYTTLTKVFQIQIINGLFNLW